MPGLEQRLESPMPPEFKVEKRKGPPPIPEAAKRKMPPPLPEAARAKARAAEEEYIKEIREEIGAPLEKEKGGETIFASSEKSTTKEKNQDAIAAGDNFVLVADGVGGEAGGHEASHAIAYGVRDIFETRKKSIDPILAEGDQAKIERLMLGTISETQQRVAEIATANPDIKNLSSTFSMVLRWKTPETKKMFGLVRGGGEERVTIGHFGDSRVYRLREGKLERITKDESLAQELIDQGVFPDDQSTDVRYTVQELEEKIVESAQKKYGIEFDEETRKKVLRKVGKTFGFIEKAPKLIKQGNFKKTERGNEATFSINEIRSGIETAINANPKCVERAKIFTVDAKKGDKFFVTSDGIHDQLYDAEIEAIANKWADNPEMASEMMLIASKIRGGKKKIENYPELQGLIRMDDEAKARAKAEDDSSAGVLPIL